MSIETITAAVTRLLVEAERLERSLSHHEWEWAELEEST